LAVVKKIEKNEKSEFSTQFFVNLHISNEKRCKEVKNIKCRYSLKRDGKEKKKKKQKNE